MVLPSLPKADVLGVAIDAVSVADLHAAIARAIAEERRVTILHVNAHCLNLAWTRPWLRQYLNDAELVVCDGKGVQYAARWLGTRLPERITYADWMWQLAAWAAARGFSFYFLGGQPGIARKAAGVLQSRWPALKVAGCHHGYFDQTPGSADNQRIVTAVNRADPDILVTAFGMPLQEQWLARHRARVRARVALAGGAAFDYLSGELARGPRFLTQHGWEWLARLCIEPRRLWRRYLLGNPLFAFRVLKQKLRSRPGGDEPAARRTR